MDFSVVSSRSAGDWQLDVNVPVLLSTLKHLPQHFNVASNKLEVAEGQASHLYFSGQGGSVGEKRHGFLSLTYTRALCKNVLSKIKKLNVEVTNSLGISEQCIPSTLFFHKWLSEICLKVEAFDAVFHISTLEEIRHLWSPLKDRREQTAFKTSQSAAHLPKMSTKQSAILASHMCPLVHADISCVRVFLLTNVDRSTPKDHEVEEPFPKTTLTHDMLLLQLQAVRVQPYADNPLPRYALERELFHCALQAGLTQQAGFCIEDRQYQLQISAASVSSGRAAFFYPLFMCMQIFLISPLHLFTASHSLTSSPSDFPPYLFSLSHTHTQTFTFSLSHTNTHTCTDIDTHSQRAFSYQAPST